MSAPVVHCITNFVTAERVADALAAAGAQPIFASALEEVTEIASRADALVLNCGTPSAERFVAMRVAAEAARGRELPIVLDPVGCGASAWRTRAIRELVGAIRPEIIRGSAAEIAALVDIDAGVALRGVSTVGTADTEGLARAASARLGAVVVVTGARDAIACPTRSTARDATAFPYDRLVGAGDVLDALIALACVGEPDRMAAAAAGLTRFATAARHAGAAGPGSFWPAFLDGLAS